MQPTTGPSGPIDSSNATPGTPATALSGTIWTSKHGLTHPAGWAFVTWAASTIAYGIPALFFAGPPWVFGGFFLVPTALAAIVGLWPRWRFRSPAVASIALDLAEHGLFKGREGRKRARTMRAYDLRARELNRVIHQLNIAREDLLETDHVEPLLVEELETRRNALQAEREVLFA